MIFNHLFLNPKQKPLMTKFKKLLAILIVGTIVLTSATIAPIVKPAPSERIENLSRLIDLAKVDGKISSVELRNIATVAKGAKLSLREKIALKIFGKRVGKKIMATTTTGGEGKSQLIALILVIFVGGMGIHRFYLGYTWQGIVQLLTLGGCGIWSLIDLIRIITGDLKPKDAEYDSTL